MEGSKWSRLYSSNVSMQPRIIPLRKTWTEEFLIKKTNYMYNLTLYLLFFLVKLGLPLKVFLNRLLTKQKELILSCVSLQKVFPWDPSEEILADPRLSK